MIPTIDISLIGIILAIWHVVKVIWDYTTRALNWITQRALSVFIGSKFWATAAFFAVGISLIGVLSSFLDFVIENIIDESTSLSPDSSFLGFAFLYIPADSLRSVFSTAVACIASYMAIVNLDFARRGVLHFFDILSKSWKT